MAITRTQYAKDTWIERSHPWGLNVAARVLCPDGVVRKCKRIAPTADTFFSTPAAVEVRGKTVAGFVTMTTASGLSTATDADPAYLVFHPYKYRKNADAFVNAFLKG
jgi:hypothetical protein